jgi:hypothetical protein
MFKIPSWPLLSRIRLENKILLELKMTKKHDILVRVGIKRRRRLGLAASG